VIRNELIRAQRTIGMTIYNSTRQQYYEVLDVVRGELTRRFEQANCSIVQAIENIIIHSANGKEVHITHAVREAYKHDLDFHKLTMQLTIIPGVVKQTSIKEVTTVHTVCDLFNV
jgi:hypothetical protein